MNYKTFIEHADILGAEDRYKYTSWWRVYRLAKKYIHACKFELRRGLIPTRAHQEIEEASEIVLGTLYAHLENVSLFKLDGHVFLNACSALRSYDANENPPAYIRRAKEMLDRGEKKEVVYKRQPTLVDALATAWKKGLK